jgi:hypothetical protein
VQNPGKLDAAIGQQIMQLISGGTSGSIEFPVLAVVKSEWFNPFRGALNVTEKNRGVY